MNEHTLTHTADSSDKDSESQDEAGWLEEIVEKINQLSEYVDDVVISLYPPHNSEAIMEQALTLRRHANELLATMHSSKRVGNLEKFKKMESVVSTMLDQAEAQIKEAL